MDKNLPFEIAQARPDEHAPLGRVLRRAYAALDGFPGPDEQPAYYEMLSNIGAFAGRPGVRLLVARSGTRGVLGGVVYFSDMSQYGSGGIATSIRNASGFRLLGVDPDARGCGIGKALAQACVELARRDGSAEVVLHTTRPMRTAWDMYERMGFVRSRELDFTQQGLEVSGFRMPLLPGSAKRSALSGDREAAEDAAARLVHRPQEQGSPIVDAPRMHPQDVAGAHPVPPVHL